MGHPSRESGTPRIVGIVGASGAQHALPIILSGLPDKFSVPILVVIGMPDSNVDHFATYLTRTSRLPIVVAEDGQVPQPGTVYVAGTERRLLLEQGRLRFARREPKVFDTMATLFRTMARELGPGAVAVILSGLGENCGEGMKAVRDAGGHTIAQDERTSMVYGMARRAVESGAVCESLPVQEIAPRLAALRVCSNSPGGATECSQGRQPLDGEAVPLSQNPFP
jgi:two-component system, chemotaxis family, protein-glutamate methylesterase/glutaminase